MKIVRIEASLATSLADFLADPAFVVQAGGVDAVAVLNDNRPCFYVLSPQGWSAMQTQGLQGGSSSQVTLLPEAKKEPSGKDSFEWLAGELLSVETQRMERGDLSRAAVGILRNRLQAHVMPFFRDLPPSRTDAATLEGFVKRLTDADFSTTTMSQYLVVVRKLLRLAV